MWYVPAGNFAKNQGPFVVVSNTRFPAAFLMRTATIDKYSPLVWTKISFRL